MKGDTETIVKDGIEFHFEWDKKNGHVSLTECCKNCTDDEEDEEDVSGDCWLETHDFKRVE